MIPPSIATLFAKPLVKYGLPVLLVVLGFAAFKFAWLPAHDRAVRAEYLVELQEAARKESARAAAAADKASAERRAVTDETLDRISNSSSVDILFGRLRGLGGTKPAPAAP
jgi:membrane protein involved in colicin uptake